VSAPDDAASGRLAVRACVFDAYGTLFDFGSAAVSCADVLGDKAGPLTALWRDKQLQYTWLRGLQDRHADFWTVTGDALEFALESLGLATPEIHTRLMSLYRTLRCFEEVPAALMALKGSGFVTAILSNGSAGMLADAVRASCLEGAFDRVLSVDAVGVFKPHPRVYQLAVDELGIPAEAIAFVSSNAWDAHAAAAFGMQAVWCNRYDQKAERLPGTPRLQIGSLDGLAARLELAGTR
jgi:2-haloacid dehalogenase